jgi:ATP-binding cassette subfamily F protein uup
MDRLVDHLFVFEGDGIIRDFPGNYSQYREVAKEPQTKEEKPKNKDEAPIATGKKKLSYKEQREFELLEKGIAALEKEKQEIYSKLNGELPYSEIEKLTARINMISKELEEKEWRWLYLSEIAG